MSLYRTSLVALAALLVALPFVPPVAAGGECATAVKILGETSEEDEWGGSEHIVDFEIRIKGCADADYTSGTISYRVLVKEADSEDVRVDGNACEWSNEERHTLEISCRLPLDIGETVVEEINPEDIYVYCYCL